MRYLLSGISILYLSCLLAVPAAAEDPATKPARAINLEVVIADAPEGAPDILTPAAILAQEKGGKLGSVARFRLTALENSKAMMQFGEMVPRATGRTAVPNFGRGGEGGGQRTMAQYSDMQTGTMLQAVARLENDGTVAVELKLTRSRIVPQKAEGGGEPAGDFTPSSVATLTVESSVNAKPGEPLLVGGRHMTTGKDATQTWVVLTANISGVAASGTSGKAAAAGAAASEIKIYKLKYAVAEQLAGVLKQALAGAPLSITADPQINALLVRGPTERLAVVETLLQQLDVGRP